MLNFALILTAVLLGVMFYTIYRMVSTGKIKAKGAKKRRRALFPIFYKKKDKVVFG